jgi:nucleoside-diphosphate-sugar epimerase
MRVFVAGASGAIGSRLVQQLVGRGHEVIGSHRAPRNAFFLRALGAEPVELDLLDPEAVLQTVMEAEPDAIAHEATALGGSLDLTDFERSFAQTNRLRSEGTDALLAAAREARVERFVAQSYASARYARKGGMVKTEEDPLDRELIAGSESYTAMQYLDGTVSAAGGVVLRYGTFYGGSADGLAEPVRYGEYPIVGDGAGVTSFIHLDDAASATVLALESNRSGIYNIVDDEPAPASEWVPVLAEMVGAEPPQHVTPAQAREFAG